MITINVSGPLDFETVPVVLKDTEEQFQNASSILIDFSNVTHCNSAALALIFTWIHHSKKRGKTLKFTNIPDQLESIADVSGVKEALKVHR